MKYYRLNKWDNKHPNVVGIMKERYYDPSYNTILLELKNGASARRDMSEVNEISEEEYYNS